MRVSVSLGALALATTITGCLPADDRPPPGSVVVRVSADPEARAGFVTGDGWTIRFDELLIAIGNVRLAHDVGRCRPYSGFFYTRILDLLVAEPQTVSTQFGLGDCVIGLQIDGVSEETDLVTNVGEDQEAFMRQPGDDAFVRGRPVVFHAAGSARDAGRTVRFAWSFRRSFDYRACEPVVLERGRTGRVDVELQTRKLFEDTTAGGASLRFDPFAAADADGDGAVTLDELGAGPSEDARFETLAERLYLGALPALLSIGGQPPCSTERLPD